MDDISTTGRSEGIGSVPSATVGATTVPPSGPSRVDRTAEGDVLAHLRAGQRDLAFRLLMKTYGKVVLAFIVRILRDQESAKDVRQQVFLDAYQAMESFEGRGTLLGWLCRIALNRSFDELRRNKRLDARRDFDVWEALTVHVSPSVDEELRTRRALEDCLATLRNATRAQLLMRMFLGFSYAEIGQASGEADSTVQVRISRTLPRLKQCLREKGVAR